MGGLAAAWRWTGAERGDREDPGGTLWSLRGQAWLDVAGRDGLEILIPTLTLTLLLLCTTQPAYYQILHTVFHCTGGGGFQGYFYRSSFSNNKLYKKA